MAELILVCGLSGSGKTTYSKILKEDQKQNDYLIVCPDEIRKLFTGSDTDRHNTFEVWQTLYLIVHAAEINNRNVILDTNALTVAQRNQFVEWFPTFSKFIVYVSAPKELRRQNNLSRRRVVPDHVMDNMEALLEVPTEDEYGWSGLMFINNYSNDGFVVSRRPVIDSL